LKKAEKELAALFRVTNPDLNAIVQVQRGKHTPAGVR